ncbi:MAG: hypothetical protein ACYTFK_10940 [Planctomycetota bacterium]|jgi:hypothetical protein
MTNKDEGARDRLGHSDLLELKRWNTPTIYNGWEQITECDSARECFNLEVCHDYMPQMGPMVGYSKFAGQNDRRVSSSD